MVIKILGGKPYDYILCPVCEVWILTSNFKKHKGSLNCKHNEEHKEIRKRVEYSVLGNINRVVR